MIPWWCHCTNLYQFWALNSLTHHIWGRLCKESVARMDPSIGHLEDQPRAWPSLAVQGKDGYWMATGSLCLLLCSRGCFWGRAYLDVRVSGKQARQRLGHQNMKYEWVCWKQDLASTVVVFSLACGIFLRQGLPRQVIMPGCLTIVVSRGSQSRSGLWSEVIWSHAISTRIALPRLLETQNETDPPLNQFHFSEDLHYKGRKGSISHPGTTNWNRSSTQPGGEGMPPGIPCPPGHCPFRPSVSG